MSRIEMDEHNLILIAVENYRDEMGIRAENAATDDPTYAWYWRERVEMAESVLKKLNESTVLATNPYALKHHAIKYQADYGKLEEWLYADKAKSVGSPVRYIGKSTEFFKNGSSYKLVGWTPEGPVLNSSVSGPFEVLETDIDLIDLADDLATQATETTMKD